MFKNFENPHSKAVTVVYRELIMNNKNNSISNRLIAMTMCWAVLGNIGSGR